MMAAWKDKHKAEFQPYSSDLTTRGLGNLKESDSLERQAILYAFFVKRFSVFYHSRKIEVTLIINNKNKMKKVTIKVTVSDSELTEALSHLTKEDLKKIITEEEINRKRALKIAAAYGLEFEVRTCIDLIGMTPTEALAEWDLL